MNNLGLKVPAQPGYINWPMGNQDRILRYEVHFFIKKYSVRRFCMVIRFFHPRHNGQWPPTSKDFYPRCYPFHFFLS